MLSHQQKLLQASRRVIAWCAANPGLVPPAEGPPAAWPPLTRQFDTLAIITNQLADAATQQQVQFVSSTLASTDEPVLRQHLRDELRVVTQVGQALKKQVPGIGILKMPKPGMQSEALLKSADVVIQQAATYESVLVEHGLASDFLAQLRSAMAALKASIDGRGAANAARASATKQVKVNVGLVHQYVKLMDAQLTKTLKTNPAKLAEWKTAKRVVIKGVLPAGAGAALTMLHTPADTAPALVPPSAAPAEVKAA